MSQNHDILITCPPFECIISHMSITDSSNTPLVDGYVIIIHDN